jgi:hypothetical protein
MAKIDIKTQVDGPDEIRITLVREDYLETSNTFRIFFEVCLGIAGTILGGIISLVNEDKSVPMLNWIFFGLMILGSIAFLILTAKNYKKAKSQTVVGQ